MDAPPLPFTAVEAEQFLTRAARILARLEEAERPCSYAVPKTIMTAGDASVLLSALIALIIHNHPFLVPRPETCVDLVAQNIHEAH